MNTNSKDNPCPIKNRKFFVEITAKWKKTTRSMQLGT